MSVHGRCALDPQAGRRHVSLLHTLLAPGAVILHLSNGRLLYSYIVRISSALYSRHSFVWLVCFCSIIIPIKSESEIVVYV